MDYKNLIKKLEYQAETIRNNNCTTMSAEESEAAANAIKTLLTERDAAIEDMQRDCINCANAESNNSNHTPCEFTEFCRFAEHWQWRGPQKHD